MNGVRIDISPTVSIAVDYWRRDSATVVACFLTHLHADHTAGLSNTWTGAPLFCSHDTRALMLGKWPAVAERARILEVGEVTSLQLRCRDGSMMQLQVTPLDACHCLGAVMFLFEGSFGRYLHTGDFRWELASQPSLLAHPALAGPPLDRLYLDNTYCAPRYAFPPRLDACKAVIAAVLAHPEHHVVLGVDSLGKEELLAAVAAASREPVCVLPARLAAVRLLGLPERLFTSDPAATRLSALPRHQVTVRLVAELNRRRPTLAIVPSAHASAAAPAAAAAPFKLSGGPRKGGLTCAELDHARQLLKQVPYSLHCSFAELQAFVKALAPCAIVPVVAPVASAKHGCADAERQFAHLLSRSPAVDTLKLAPTRDHAQQPPSPAVPLLHRLLGKRAVCADASTGAMQLRSWQQALMAAAELVRKRRRIATTLAPS